MKRLLIVCLLAFGVMSAMPAAAQVTRHRVVVVHHPVHHRVVHRRVVHHRPPPRHYRHVVHHPIHH